MKMLEGKAVIVTGAASGIGAAAARLIAAAGGNVLLADRDAGAGEQVAEQIRAGGGTAHAVAANVADEDSVAAMVRACLDRYGRIDGAFNNAGIGYPDKPIHELAREEWQRTIDVNLTGVFLCMKHEIAAMLQAGRGGSIVNTGSVASVVGLPNAGVYNAAKHGMLGLTRNATVDYARHNIRVNAILVGATVTPMLTRQIPDAESNADLARQLSQLHRLAQPEEIAQAALWLLSDLSSFVAGSALTIDGGYTAA